MEDDWKDMLVRAVPSTSPLRHQGQRCPTIASVPVLRAARETEQTPKESAHSVRRSNRRELPSLY